MMKSMITALVAISAAVAPSCEATTHRRTGTELYRVQPTQKIMPKVLSRHSDFETFDEDAQRALRELMAYPRRQLSIELIESLEILSLDQSMPKIEPLPPQVSDTPSDGFGPGTGGSSATIPSNGGASGPGGSIGGTGGGSAPKNTVEAVNRAAGGGANGKNGINKPATISVSVFLLIAAMAATALVVRKYRRAAAAAAAGDDQSIMSGPSIFSTDSSIPSPV